MTMSIKLISILLAFICSSLQAESLSPKHNAEVNLFLHNTSKELKIEYPTLSKHFEHLTTDDRITARMKAPFESKPWHHYKNAVVTSKRINKGVAFYNKYQKEVLESSKKHQIPVHVILGIIGIESNFMENLGQYNALKSLATLSFSHDKRQRFFRSELKALLKMEKDYHFKIDQFPSSYAGALGMIQFMPSNYLKYAISKHGYMSPDIFYNTSDSVLSIGNFLHNKCHWIPNGSVAARWHPSPRQSKMISSYVGVHPIQKLDKNGTHIPKHLRSGAISVAIMDGKPKKEYWVLYNNSTNFKCYNNSLQYVIATNLLGKAIVMNYNKSARS
jgi:membrane-bound lytic murein transglycosylase B